MAKNVCVLTGEGARGAFQARQLNQLHRIHGHFDKYVGISSGALVAFLCSHFTPEVVAKVFKDTSGMKDVFRFSILGSIFGTGLTKTDPIKDRLEALLSEPGHLLKEPKPCVVSWCDMRDGTIHHKNITPMSNSMKVKLLLRAVSIPGLVEASEEYLVDAGIFEINPANWEIKNNSELEKLTIISAKDLKMPPFEVKEGLIKSKQMAMRALDMIMYSMTVDDLRLPYFPDQLQFFGYVGPEIGALEFNKSAWLYEKALENNVFYDKEDIRSNVF